LDLGPFVIKKEIEEGGMVLELFKEFNEAKLAKQSWRIIT
jgi:hypothetical protein